MRDGFDLHTHTTWSDGRTGCAAVAAAARAAGLRGLAITDHDTADHLPDAAAACAAVGLEHVPGLELSAEEADGTSVHLLALWVDPHDPDLVAELRRLRGERERRARAMVAKLREAGVPVTWEAVAARAAGPVGRPHVARALVAAGAVADEQEAFDRWLADGAPAWEPKHALAPEDAVRIAVGAGGVAVLAHPGLESRGGASHVLVDRLCAAGLAGVEADHAGHDPDVAAWWRVEAARRDLVATGGSDWHGAAEGPAVGDRSTAQAAVDDLRSRRP